MINDVQSLPLLLLDDLCRPDLNRLLFASGVRESFNPVAHASDISIAERNRVLRFQRELGVFWKYV
jgi:hypothetical protein